MTLPLLRESSPMPMSEPLDLACLSTIPIAARRAIFLDFVNRGDAEPILDCLSLNLFAPEGGSPPDRADLDFCAHALAACGIDVFDRVVNAIAEALSCRSAKLARSHSKTGFSDFGPLGVFFCLGSLSSAQSGNHAKSEELLAKASAIVRSLPIDDSANFSEPSAYGNQLPIFDQARLYAAEQDTPFAGGRNPSAILQAAVALMPRDDGRMVEAVLSRPDFLAKMRLIFPPRDARSAEPAPLGPFSFLGASAFWRELPEEGCRILDTVFSCLGRAADPESFPPQILRAMIVVQASPFNEGFLWAKAMLGENVFAVLANQDPCRSSQAWNPSAAQNSAVSQAWNTAVSLAKGDPSLAPAVASVCRLLNDPQLPHFERMFRDGTYRLAMLAMLYHPAPGVSEAASEIIEARIGGSPGSAHGVFPQLFSGMNLGIHIGRLAECPRPEIVLAGLSAMGLEAFDRYPEESRKGHDKTALMLFAGLASPPVFDAALGWLDSQGALRRHASSKAWVFSDGETRKKGDLLAFCVASGRADLALTLLGRIPDLDLKCAKAVAASMAKNSKSSAGSLALSAWEEVLLELASPSPIGNPAPAAARRPRL